MPPTRPPNPPRTSSSASSASHDPFGLPPLTLATLDRAFLHLPINSHTSSFSALFAHLGAHNPFAYAIDPHDTIVWLLDNTAYRVAEHAAQPWRVQPWETCVVAACFVRDGGGGSGDDGCERAGDGGAGDEKSVGQAQAQADERRMAVRRAVRCIAEVAEVKGTKEVASMIEERLMPWTMRRVVGRTAQVVFEERLRRGQRAEHAILQADAMTLVPTEANGVSKTVLRLPEDEYRDGEALEVFATSGAEGSLAATTHTCSGKGFAVVSTVEVTLWEMEGMSPKTIFRKAFVDKPTTIDYMPELLEHMRVEFKTSHFWYLANAPVSLYPIVRELREMSYPPGTILLRDGSWTTASGLLSSFLHGVKEHKLEQLEKLHETFPRRSFILLGSCSLVDPEVFAEMYQRYPDWVKAIFVRFDGPESLLVPSPHQGATKKMVENIFKSIPKNVWCIFSKPHEIHERISSLGKSPTKP